MLLIDEVPIIADKNTNPFDNACYATGISKMHVMQFCENETCLSRNCTFQVSAYPDIALKRDVCQVTDPLIFQIQLNKIFQNTTQIMI